MFFYKQVPIMLGISQRIQKPEINGVLRQFATTPTSKMAGTKMNLLKTYTFIIHWVLSVVAQHI